MMKLFRKLHHIPSILLGLPLFVIFFTGFLLLFQEDVERLQNPSLYRVEQGGEPLPLEELIAEASEALGEDKKIASITTGDATTPYLIGIKGERNRIALNQYNGEVLGERTPSPFFRKVLFLHRFMLDTPQEKGQMTVGKMVVGVSTIFCIFILISGLAIWVPKTTKGLRNRLKISLSKGWKRFWFDTHVAGGFYVALLLLIICFTGLYWSFGWYREGLIELVTSPEREAMVMEAKKAATQNIAGVMVVDANADTPQSIHALVKSIHMGTWGGNFSKVLYAVAMVVALTLPITGYWLWWKRKRSKRLRSVRG